MIDNVYLVVSIAAALVSSIIIISNWYIAIRSFYDKSYRSSLVWFVGTILGVFAIVIFPVYDIGRYWWYPVVLDWGGGLSLIVAPILYLTRKQRSQ